MFFRRYSSYIRAPKLAAIILLLLSPILLRPIAAQSGNESTPESTTKLVFIHHSTGENWLANDDGGLGLALAENNYFVSDTNYGWGPDSIGDRTDITDWPEWFSSQESDRYLSALYNQSDENSWYTRPLPDPGGENQIIMFKSCFPNSSLEGNPNDPPRRGQGLTVSNAKAIYNELLAYFSTRPDKLFVVITAPPLQDPTYAANARAFNTWLVMEWLQGYDGSNVAVFDFYNVLTGPDNHHRFHDGQIEYVTDRENDTLYYDSNGDDHPSTAGNHKAAAELLPLLNVYYNRWQENALPPPVEEDTPANAPVEPEVEPPPESTVELEPAAPQTAVAGSLLDDFESAHDGWIALDDETGESSIECQAGESVSFAGSASLHIEYDIASGGWANCNLIYESPQNWRDASGITVYLQAEQLGQPVILTVFQGESADELALFEYRLAANQEAVDGWQQVEVTWEQLREPPWQGDGTAVFEPAQAMGLAFSFEGPEDGRSSGELQADEIRLLAKARTDTGESTAPEIEASPSPPPDAPEQTGEGGFVPCSGSIAAGLSALAAVVWVRQREDR